MKNIPCGSPNRRSMVIKSLEPTFSRSSFAYNHALFTPIPPILRIAPEIALTIFEHVLCGANYSYLGDIPQTRWTLMLVCRYFCTIITSHPTLWSFIPVARPFPNFCAIDRALARAGNARLQFHLDLRVEELEQDWCNPQMLDMLMTRYILPRMNQVEQLIFMVDEMDTVDHIFSSLSKSPAPVLTTFKLVIGDLLDMEPLSIRHPSAASDSHPSLFSGIHPKLTKFSFHFVPVHYIASTARNVRHLDLSLQKALDPSLFMDILTSIDHLESLTLRNTGPAYDGRTHHSSPIPLPYLRRLVIGGMDPEYVDYLLSIFNFSSLRELGVFVVGAEDCDKLWSILARYNMQRSIFNQLEMLELFQVSTSTSTIDIHHPFSMFLSSLHHLHTIRMRRTTTEYLEVLGAREGETWAIQGDSLQVLELSSMVENREDGGDYNNDSDEDEDDDFEPVAMQVLAEMLVELFEERKGHWNVKRLHLDEEWDPSRGKSLLESLRALGEEWAPIVHWDARAPFFHDYYDSGEI